MIENLKWGVGWGLWLAAAFVLLGAALFLIQGTVLGHPSKFSFPLVVLGYFAMGVLGGALAGVLRPLAESQWGAIIAGVTIGIIVYAIAGIIAVGEKELFSLPGVISTLILGTLIGGALAAPLGKITPADTEHRGTA